MNQYGNLGVRKTVIHMGDKTVHFSNEQGRVRFEESEDSQQVSVWNAEDELLYEGPLPEKYQESLPSEAVDLLEQFFESREKLDKDISEEEKFEISIKTGDSVTLTGR